MATNIALDDHLIELAVKAGNHRTKKEAVTAALQEYVQRRQQLEVLDLAGTVDYDPLYDPKTERRRR
jgi:Arc/MetJ family transcription regulator